MSDSETSKAGKQSLWQDPQYHCRRFGAYARGCLQCGQAGCVGWVRGWFAGCSCFCFLLKRYFHFDMWPWLGQYHCSPGCHSSCVPQLGHAYCGSDDDG